MIDDPNNPFQHLEEDYHSENNQRRRLSEGRKSFWKVFAWVNVILLCAALSHAAYGNDCSEWNSLSAEQQYRLEYAYNYGKPYDKQWTMASLALHESNGGRYRINIKSKDFGLFQINEKNIFNILGVTSYWKKQEMITKVVMDDALGAYLALDVLQHFEKVHKGNWKKMIMSYNIGNKKDYKSLKKGVDYYNKVVHHMNILKRCSNFK